MVPIQVIRWYRMQCYDGTDSCATVVPIRRYCQITAIFFRYFRNLSYICSEPIGYDYVGNSELVSNEYSDIFRASVTLDDLFI